MAMALGSFATRVVATKVVALDGTGDFTTIEDALAALPASGGVVYLKEGTFSPSGTDPISLSKDNVAIIGAGKATELRPNEGQYFFRADSLTGLRFSNMYINGAALVDCEGIRLESCTNSFIDSVWFNNLGGMSIYLVTSTLIQVISTITLGASAAPLVLHGGSRNIVTNSSITGSSSTYGVEVRDDSDRNVISANIIYGFSGGTGVALKISDSNCDKNLILGNIFYNNTTDISDSGTGTEAAHNMLS